MISSDHAFTIYQVSAITLKPEFYENAKEAILNITPQTLAEPECRVFVLHEPSSSDGTTLYIYEIFDSEEAFYVHHAQSYTKTVYKSYEIGLQLL